MIHPLRELVGEESDVDDEVTEGASE